MKIFLDEEPTLEEELKEAYSQVVRKCLSQNPSTAELEGYALYLLSDPYVETNIPLPDAVAYVADSLNTVSARSWRNVATHLVLLASSPDSDELRELIEGYSSSGTAFDFGRTPVIEGPRPGNDKVGKVWRNAWYGGGGVDPSIGDKTYEHAPNLTGLDQEQF